MQRAVGASGVVMVHGGSTEMGAWLRTAWLALARAQGVLFPRNNNGRDRSSTTFLLNKK